MKEKEIFVKEKEKRKRDNCGGKRYQEERDGQENQQIDNTYINGVGFVSLNQVLHESIFRQCLQQHEIRHSFLFLVHFLCFPPTTTAITSQNKQTKEE
jgi:hypothetical protein